MIRPIRITPMPPVAKALIYVRDAESAIVRALESWHAGQLEDALDSAEKFIDKARTTLRETA